MRVSCKVYLRKTSIEGLMALYMRITIRGKEKVYSLQKKTPALPDQKKQLTTEQLLIHHQARANEIIHRFEISRLPISFELFERDFFGPTNGSFIAYCRAELKSRAHEYSPGTYRHKEKAINKLEKFCPELGFLELDEKILRSFTAYLKNNIGNCSNTIAREMRQVRFFIRLALYDGHISKDPMQRMKFREVETFRPSLSRMELQHLERIVHSTYMPAGTKENLKAFLFMCFTGLRFSDLKKLTAKDIEGGSIHIITEKTGRMLAIPMSHRAKNLLPRAQKIGPLFKLYTNQYFNRSIKELMKAQGIHKKISAHSARHTFAMMALELGIDIKTISELLGHSSVTITEIYARQSGAHKAEQMARFDSL